MAKRIPIIKQGEEYAPYYAIVDDEDYPLLSRLTWHLTHGPTNQTVYARVVIDGFRIKMHNLIMGFSLVDHKNRIGLDNRKENLRVAIYSQNQANAAKRRTHNGIATTSQYKGVTWNKYHNKWLAKIRKDGKDYHLGYFLSEEDAAKAYDKKAVELYGEFARPNFPG